MSNKKYELYAHQKELISLAPHKHLLAWSTGVGKTITALELAGDKNTLIITPKSIKEQWEEQTSHPVITKETFRRDWNKLPAHECIIIDESHFFFGMQTIKKMSQMLKSLLSYIKKHNPEYRYLLTATPYLSSPYNIYAAAKILGRDWKYMQFKNRYFESKYFGGRFPASIPKEGIEKEMAILVNRIGSTVKMEDCFDVPEQVFLKETFELTAEQEKAMDEVEEEGIARWTRHHQICGGTLKGDKYHEDQFFKCEKTQRLEELVSEHKKIVAVFRYNNEINYFYEKFKNKYNVFKINGETKDKHSVVKEANNAERAIVLVQGAASEGYSLASFPIMVFYSYDFSLKNYIQMKGRILRANHLKKNVYISLVVKNSIDEDVYKTIINKKDFQIALYNKD